MQEYVAATLLATEKITWRTILPMYHQSSLLFTDVRLHLTQQVERKDLANGRKDTRQMQLLQLCKVQTPRILLRVQGALYQALVQPKKILKLKYVIFRASKQMKFSPTLKKMMILGFTLKVFRLLLQNVSVVTQEHIARSVAVGPSSRTGFFSAYHSIIASPDSLRSLCGVDGNVLALLLGLLPTVRDRSSDVTVENKLLIFLMKMKLGISFSAVVTLFGVHEKTASRAFYSVLHTLLEITRDWIYKPPITDIMLSQPSCFKANYPQRTLIIDCTELKTETPPEVRQQHMLYSPYKGTYTLKFPVAIIPNGIVVFKSKPYGRRCSDTHIKLDFKFLNIIEAEDTILADRGFPGIRTSLADRVILIMPPFSAGSTIPFTPEEIEQTYSVASV
ncbi:uncharacterized protein LOC119392744 [Rhipicephalus sanguineus]|uniref:uncharacterized protein LOC119392744 n=1 Tax=Rhipicephalus sanguineus TaxID=34632 RepID=UPI001894F896|nr:uncharacterized protein LOC119392744 [Rhipicephalus sanguineus]